MLSRALKVCFIFSTLLDHPAFACGLNSREGFLPSNHMRIPADVKNAGISEADFHSVVDLIEKHFLPVVQNSGSRMVIERKWLSPRVNAGTYRDNKDNHIHINLYGGLARHAHMTKDGLTLVLCHELGHHFGGAPKKIPSTAPWSSSEGQADYFATLKCLRKVFEEDDNQAIVEALSVPSKIKQSCESQFESDEESSLCQRTAMAGLSVASVNAATFNFTMPSSETMDSTQVAQTLLDYPKPQCRYDTYLQGSLCDVNKDDEVSQTDEIQGTCHTSLGHKVGTRPLCWFHPKT